MVIYCVEDFKILVERYKKKAAYRNIEPELIEFLFDKTIEELKAGTCLNNNSEIPYIKKRINGSGGYRLYYLIMIKDDNLYLMYIHPKTGPFAASNLSADAITELYTEVSDAITHKNLFIVTSSEDRKTLKFKKHPK